MRSDDQFDMSLYKTEGKDDVEYRTDLEERQKCREQEAADAADDEFAMTNAPVVEYIAPAEANLADVPEPEKEEITKIISMKCMGLAPRKIESRYPPGGEAFRASLESELKSHWESTSGWNTRLELVKKITFSFKFEAQDLAKICTKDELLVRMRKSRQERRTDMGKGPRPSQAESPSAGEAVKKNLSPSFADGSAPDEAPTPKKPRAD